LQNKLIFGNASGREKKLHLIFLCISLKVYDINLKSYAGGSVATGRVSQAGQVMSEVPD
jgi:hypothetical protein